jgi:6-pyruvoyl-tetrahydropterin synthase
MFVIRKQLKTISLAHRLREVEPCHRLHGHNYRAWLTFQAEGLDRLGMALDFHKVSEFNKMWALLDHREIAQNPDSDLHGLPPEKMIEPLVRREGLIRPGWIVEGLEDQGILTPWPPTAENLSALLFGWARAWFSELEGVELIESEIEETDGNTARYRAGP